jgi:hypothetical protein
MMKISALRTLVMLAAWTLAAAHLTGCKKEMTVEDCKAKCVTVGAEQAAKCTMAKEICDEAKRKGDENCNKTCELAFPKK